MEFSKKPQTLVVDDEEAIHSLLSRALISMDHSVLVAESVESAISHLASKEFDLLIVDKNLLDGSGLEVIEAAREKGHRSESIVITGYSDTDSSIEAVSLGVFRYLRKPFDLAALKLDINNALETGKLKQDLANRTNDLEKTNKELWLALKRVFESERRTRQAERLANIGYLSAGVAHEINNPLSLLSMIIPFVNAEFKTLITNLKDLTETNQLLPSLMQISSSLEPTQEAVEFLMRLASDLHSLGRTEKGHPQSTVKLSEVTGSAMRLTRHQLKHKASVVLDVPDDLIVPGHASRLVQVFINLLTNAAKAIQEAEHEDNTLSITATASGEHVFIEVSDTGIGISKEHLDKIFEPFFTFSIEHGDEGSGIGLAIVKEIIEEHGGSISVTSEEGKGSTFTIKLTRIASAIGQPALLTPEGVELTRGKRIILFVDSELPNLHAYQEAFGTMHDVLLASDIQEAMSILERQHQTIDVFVCSLPKQGKAQDDFFNHLETWPEMRERVIFVSEPGTLTDSAKDKGYRVLEKPVKLAFLLGNICRIPPRSNKNHTLPSP
jgi:two-component system NtrC family sensor kinase